MSEENLPIFEVFENGRIFLVDYKIVGESVRDIFKMKKTNFTSITGKSIIQSPEFPTRVQIIESITGGEKDYLCAGEVSLINVIEFKTKDDLLIYCGDWNLDYDHPLPENK